jgi:hypothetical protein
MLLLENILGFEISSRGGTFGGTLSATEFGVPPGPPLSVGPLNPTNLLVLLLPVDGSIWNGSMSLSRAFRCFLLLQHANKMRLPSATAPPPMEATVMPIICGLVKVGVGEGVGDMEDAMAEYVLAAGVLLAGDPDDVINLEVETCVLLMLIVFDQFELDAVVIDGPGATRTMLGIELCTIKVAVIVA